MRVGTVLLLAGLALADLALAGCASPNPRYYALGVVAGSPRHGPAGAVVVRSAVVPHYLERDEIVRGAANNRVRVSGNDWWSEPLRQMLQRVLAADLAQRLPGTPVLGTEALGGEGASVVLAVERFEPDGSQTVVLDGYLAIEAAGRDRILRQVALRVPLNGDGTGDQVAAMDQALAAVADLATAALAGR